MMQDPLDDDAPKLTQVAFDNAKLRIAQQEVTRVEWQASVPARMDKPGGNKVLNVSKSVSSPRPSGEDS